MSDAVGGRVGTVIKGKWHVDARIGSGGMATVYAATHRNGHRAALKMLHAQLSRDAAVRARFLREAYVANTVTHPAVVRVDDDDVTDDGCVFLVMELLEGETLEARRLHNANGALPIGEVMEIGEQALDALAAAHEKGIIHRDVKPENVFVTKAGRVKLLDFGLARMKDLQGESTKTGVTIGTPEFMPPEQAMAKRGNVDARSDVWGMGATLFTALSGKYVHDASNLHQQLMAAATQRARSVRSVATHVPLAVGQVIDRALELDMNDRWPTAREMQRALRAARGAPAEASLESLTMQAALPADAPLPSEDVPFPISSDKTVAVSDVISSDKPTLQRPITLQDKTIALAAPTSSSPSTERIAQKETKRLDTTAKLAPTTPRMSGQSGENRALAGSGANPALGFSASGENPAHGFSASGENPALRQSPRMLAASGVSPVMGASGMNPSLGGSGANPSLGASGMNPSLVASGMNPSLGGSGANPALGASGMNPSLGASGANPALGASGTNPSLDPSGSRPRFERGDPLARSGSGSVAPASPSRARGALVAIVLVLLGVAALVLAVLARTGHLPR